MRIVLEDASGNEDGDEVIFEKKQEAREKPIRIVTVERVETYCQSTRDFFSLDSRIVMNAMFRPYLEKVFLTPTEILHSKRELDRLCDTDNLYPAAVDNIARLQIKDTSISQRERRDQLYAIVEQIGEQAQRAEGIKLPRVGERFSDVLRKVASVGDEAPEYLAMVALSRDLIGIRNWVGKLDRLCKLAMEEKPGSKPMLLLDTVIADVIGANVVQELLGWQRSLGSAIIGLLDLADGVFNVADSENREVSALLNELLAKGALPASQSVLVDRAIKQLRSPQPLFRNEPEKEMEEYMRVLARLLVPGGILSGAAAAEAITLRGARFVEQGGAAGRRTAIGATVKAMPDPARGVMYLSELSKTDLASDHIDDIVKELDLVFSARVIGELCRRSMSPKDRMLTATGAFRAAATSALPGDLKERVTEHIDGVLERYLVDENVVERLDHPDAHIRDRAVRLVKFCGAGVLPEGKALAMARKRIVKLLRRPDFDRELVSDITDPEAKERIIRDFHKLLVSAGIA